MSESLIKPKDITYKQLMEFISSCAMSDASKYNTALTALRISIEVCTKEAYGCHKTCSSLSEERRTFAEIQRFNRRAVSRLMHLRNNDASFAYFVELFNELEGEAFMRFTYNSTKQGSTLLKSHTSSDMYFVPPNTKPLNRLCNLMYRLMAFRLDLVIDKKMSWDEIHDFYFLA